MMGRIIRKKKQGCLGRVFSLLILALIWLVVLAFTCWAALVIYFSPLPLPWLRVMLACGLMALAVVTLWKWHEPGLILSLTGALLLVTGWFISLQPSQDRNWRPDVAVLPRAEVNGHQVRLVRCRDFSYTTKNDFEVRYEDREVDMSHLTSVDMFVSYWKPDGLIAHTFLSFNFDNAEPVSISIEARPEVGEKFGAFGSLFKQFELIYVVGNERDLVRVRSNYRHELVYMYPINASPAATRRLFEIYLERINDLEKEPEFYHLLSNNCTTSIVRNAERAGSPKDWNIRYLLNGLLDGYLYNKGIIKSNLPFNELKPRSLINETAIAADKAPNFSERIRAAIPSVGSSRTAQQE